MTTNKKTTVDTPQSIDPITSIQRVQHDWYVTLSREIKLPYNNQQYTSNSISITVSRPTLEEAVWELEIAEQFMYSKLNINTPDTKELEILRARVEKANTFIAYMKSHDIIGTIFTKELQSFNSTSWQ